MKIEQFVAQSEGEWKSMRSSHSLAFQQFEQVISRIKIKLLNTNDSKVLDLLYESNYSEMEVVMPFSIEWEAESDWSEEEELGDKATSGSSIFVPIPSSSEEGVILRNLGYAESIQAKSNYHFMPNDSLMLNTEYEKTIAEEQIWFASKNVRFRSSVVRISGTEGVLQASFASEIKQNILQT